MNIKVPKWFQLTTKTEEQTSKIEEPKMNVLTSISERVNSRIKTDIKKWRNALNSAESTECNDRVPLLEIYKEIELDVNITALLDLKKDRIQQFKFHLTDENGEYDEKTKLFESKWFYDIIDYYIDSYYWGFSVLQINSIKDYRLDLELIPREYIIIDEKKYKKDLYDTNGISYNDPMYLDWLIEFNFGLGDYNKLAPIQIWKKAAIQNWATFQEIYGMPMRVGKTSSYRPEDRARFEQFLKNMGSNSYAVFDQNMDIEFKETSSTDAYNIYNEMIKFLDGEIAKLIIGGSLVNEGGASYSQSKTHGEQADIKTRSDLRNIEFWVNDYLIPKLNLHGFDIQSKFSFELTIDKFAEWVLDKDLVDRFNIDIEWLKEKYNVPLKERINLFNMSPLVQNEIISSMTEEEKKSIAGISSMDEENKDVE